MSQLKSDILCRNKKIELEKSEKLYKWNHIATPIQPHETSDNEDSEHSGIENEDDIQVSEEEEDTHKEHEPTFTKSRCTEKSHVHFLEARLTQYRFAKPLHASYR